MGWFMLLGFCVCLNCAFRNVVSWSSGVQLHFHIAIFSLLSPILPTSTPSIAPCPLLMHWVFFSRGRMILSLKYY